MALLLDSAGPDILDISSLVTVYSYEAQRDGVAQLALDIGSIDHPLTGEDPVGGEYLLRLLIDRGNGPVPVGGMSMGFTGYAQSIRLVSDPIPMRSGWTLSAQLRIGPDDDSVDVSAELYDLAGAILATPGNLLASDTAGRVTLGADGLDAIPATAPAGVAGSFREMVVQLWRRFFGKSTLTKTAQGTGELKTLADDGETVLTTQAVSDDGTTETQGEAQ